MPARVVWVVLGGLSAACVDVPPHRPCGPDDLDCDGWPAAGVRAEAIDCDDHDPAINPGAAEDPATAADDDCLADGGGPLLAGVTGGAGGWSSGPLAIAFDSPSKMPSSLTVDGDELLVPQQDNCPVTNEERMGVSLWPALAAHARVDVLSGTLTVERAGPALATSRIEWTATATAGAARPEPGCTNTTTVTGVLRFSVLPGGRLVRDDSVTLSAVADGCSGCANVATTPVLSSYLPCRPASTSSGSTARRPGRSPRPRCACPPVDVGCACAIRPADEGCGSPWPATRRRPATVSACVRSSSVPTPVRTPWSGTGRTGGRPRPVSIA